MGRIAVTGMAVNTPLADTLDGFLAALLEGRSAVTRWRSVDMSRSYSRIGADLGGYDVDARLAALMPVLPPVIAERLQRLVRRVPWSLRLGAVVVADAARDAGLDEASMADLHVVVGGHNVATGYAEQGFAKFHADPGSLPIGFELYSLDTTQAAVASELLGTRKPAYIVGGACASGNVALQAAFREIVHHGARRAIVLAPVQELTAASMQGFALLGALSIESFNDAPERASRPWDVRREGFVPGQAAGAIVLEDMDVALARGARIYAELAGVAVTSSASHLAAPEPDGQARVIAQVLRRSGLAAEDVDFVSAHATSTPAGDVVELQAIRLALGAHADRVKVNAAKSMLGHSFCAAATIEAIAGVLQMNAGILHGTRNVDVPDAGVDLDVCAGGPVRAPVRCFLNNAFGFGGINTVSAFRATRVP